MTTASNSPVVARRFTRRATTGCLVLLMIPAALLAYFWYSVWHTGNVNAQRKKATEVSVLAQARHASDAAARALTSIHSTAPNTLTSVIWQHTRAPVITYNPSHNTYTAIASWSSTYTEKALLPGGGPVKVERCFTLTSAQARGATWVTKLTERHDGMCSSTRMIASEVTLAQNRIKNMSPENVTRPEVARVLDPTHRQRAYTVKKVARHGNVAVVTVLIRHERNGTLTQQCYAFSRHLSTDTDAHPVTAVPLATC